MSSKVAGARAQQLPQDRLFGEVRRAKVQPGDVADIDDVLLENRLIGPQAGAYVVQSLVVGLWRGDEHGRVGAADTRRDKRDCRNGEEDRDHHRQPVEEPFHNLDS